MRHETLHPEPLQLGLALDADLSVAELLDPPGIRLDAWLWRIPAAVSSETLSDWLNRCSHREIPGHYPRWLTLIGTGTLYYRMLQKMRSSGLPALVLRPQAGTALEPLAEQALRSGKSDLVIAPMPAADSDWLARYNAAAVIGKTRGLLI